MIALLTRQQGPTERDATHARHRRVLPADRGAYRWGRDRPHRVFPWPGRPCDTVVLQPVLTPPVLASAEPASSPTAGNLLFSAPASSPPHFQANCARERFSANSSTLSGA